jgi:hypothetical protein
LIDIDVEDIFRAIDGLAEIYSFLLIYVLAGTGGKGCIYHPEGTANGRAKVTAFYITGGAGGQSHTRRIRGGKHNHI